MKGKVRNRSGDQGPILDATVVFAIYQVYKCSLGNPVGNIVGEIFPRENRTTGAGV